MVDSHRASEFFVEVDIGGSMLSGGTLCLRSTPVQIVQRCRWSGRKRVIMRE